MSEKPISEVVFYFWALLVVEIPYRRWCIRPKTHFLNTVGIRDFCVCVPLASCHKFQRLATSRFAGRTFTTHWVTTRRVLLCVFQLFKRTCEHNAGQTTKGVVGHSCSQEPCSMHRHLPVTNTESCRIHQWRNVSRVFRVSEQSLVVPKQNSVVAHFDKRFCLSKHALPCRIISHSSVVARDKVVWVPNHWTRTAGHERRVDKTNGSLFGDTFGLVCVSTLKAHTSSYVPRSPMGLAFCTCCFNLVGKTTKLFSCRRRFSDHEFTFWATFCEKKQEFQ